MNATAPCRVAARCFSEVAAAHAADPGTTAAALRAQCPAYRILRNYFHGPPLAGRRNASFTKGDLGNAGVYGVGFDKGRAGITLDEACAECDALPTCGFFSRYFCYDFDDEAETTRMQGFYLDSGNDPIPQGAPPSNEHNANDNSWEQGYACLTAFFSTEAETFAGQFQHDAFTFWWNRGTNVKII